MSQKTFYVTTPIYYVTAKPHLGSLYSTVLADVATRWAQLQGRQTFFLTGTDEHGQKVALAADSAGKDPKVFVDDFIPAYKDVWKAYDIDYNRFIRTTDDDHIKLVQKWVKELLDQDKIYKGHYAGWYCTPCETFVKQVPESDNPGDSQSCPDCGRDTVLVSEPCYFFRLSAYQDQLINFYKNNPDFITPRARMNEVISFVSDGLNDLCISRASVDWGIPFPGDLDQVIYVWADALNNYITAAGWGLPDKQKQFEAMWPADLQVIGKDIVRFHAVYWPAFLMASGLSLPKKLLTHGWITVDQKKMSKSLGNAVDPLELRTRYGSDVVRYYLVRKLAVSQDADFSYDDLEQTVNADLSNALGNLLNRICALTNKNEVSRLEPPSTWGEAELALRDELRNMIVAVKASMEEYQMHMAFSRVIKYVHVINAYVHSQQPWKIVRDDRDKFLVIMSAAVHALRAAAVLLWPVMPNKMEALLGALGASMQLGPDYLEKLAADDWNDTFTMIKVQPLFARIEKTKIKQEPSMDEQVKTENKSEQTFIDIQDFAKVQIATGTILSADKVEKSSKLLQLEVDCGQFGRRTILSGIQKDYSSEELVGLQGLFVLNLKPRVMMGVESQGMMLFAKDAQGSLKALTIAGKVPDGSQAQ